jgi:hypothetical protein
MNCAHPQGRKRGWTACILQACRQDGGGPKLFSEQTLEVFVTVLGDAWAGTVVRNTCQAPQGRGSEQYVKHKRLSRVHLREGPRSRSA